MTPEQVRTRATGLARGYTQANLIAVPRDWAYDMLLFAQRNPKPCPVLDVTDPGGPRTVLAPPRPKDALRASTASDIGLCETAGERTVTLRKGAVFVVPRGVFHKPSSALGAAVLLVEPSGTLSVCDEHDEVPGHVNVTTGHPLANLPT